MAKKNNIVVSRSGKVVVVFSANPGNFYDSKERVEKTYRTEKAAKRAATMYMNDRNAARDLLDRN